MNGYRRSWTYYFAVLWMISWIIIAVISPKVFFHKAQLIQVADALLAPSKLHIFGTDKLGRDIFFRVLSGSTVSLGISIASAFIAIVVGVWLGSLAGYFGKWWDRIILGITDLFMCFPVFFLVLSMVALAGPGIKNLIIIFALTGWMGVARLMRAEVSSLREREFVYLAKSIGMRELRILVKHVIPNALLPVRGATIVVISQAVLTEAGLSFLGFGAQPPLPSWGNLLMDAKFTMGFAWWTMFFPGVVIFLTVSSLNVLGEEFTRAKRVTA